MIGYYKVIITNGEESKTVKVPSKVNDPDLLLNKAITSHKIAKAKASKWRLQNVQFLQWLGGTTERVPYNDTHNGNDQE